MGALYFGQRFMSRVLTNCTGSGYGQQSVSAESNATRAIRAGVKGVAE
jgi:hypothetical protein